MEQEATVEPAETLPKTKIRAHSKQITLPEVGESNIVPGVGWQLPNEFTQSMAFGISDEHWVESLFVESAPEGYTGAEHVASKEDITLGPTSTFDII